MTSFFNDDRGNVAILFGITLIPIFGVAGAALDYNRASHLQTVLQTRADATALNVASNGQGASAEALLSDLRADLDGLSGSTSGVSVDGAWISESDFRVDASARIATAIIHMVPGIDQGLDVAVRSVARVVPDPAPEYKISHIHLEPDAGDFNELYAYCFDANGSGNKANRRSQMVKIADNIQGALDLETEEWPNCSEDGQTLSYRMRNERHAKSHPEVRHRPNRPPYYAEFDYFTDTEIHDGVEHYSISREIGYLPPAWRDYFDNGHRSKDIGMLETIICDTQAQCDPDSPQSIIPSGTNRTPEMADESCEPGQYMYYGWEDRPPDQRGPDNHWTDPAWTDEDFDDIRIVLECFERGKAGETIVRLVE